MYRSRAVSHRRSVRTARSQAVCTTQPISGYLSHFDSVQEKPRRQPSGNSAPHRTKAAVSSHCTPQDQATRQANSTVLSRRNAGPARTADPPLHRCYFPPGHTQICPTGARARTFQEQGETAGKNRFPRARRPGDAGSATLRPVHACSERCCTEDGFSQGAHQVAQ